MATLKLDHFGTKPRNDQGYIADRNLYLDAEDNLVEEDDPAQVRQLVGKGGALSTEDAEKYGLLEPQDQTGETDDGGSNPSEAKPAVKKTAKKGARK